MPVNFLNSKCIKCLIKKYTENLPGDDEEKKVAYIKRVLSAISNARDSASAPEVVEQITLAQEEILGVTTDYSEQKAYYNSLLLNAEPDIEEKINSSEDPFVTAMNYSFAGNYIDFGTVNGVKEDKLISLLEGAKSLSVSPYETARLKDELTKANNLVYIIDNCGEIVLDKLFIKVIKRNNPALNVTVITRGAPVLNDCTVEDALSVNMQDVATVVSNGTAVGGTCLDRISAEAKAVIDSADVIISKGQGNLETLIGCNKNIYYMFLCKCEKFSDKFGVAPMTAMLLNDKRIKS